MYVSQRLGYQYLVYENGVQHMNVRCWWRRADLIFDLVADVQPRVTVSLNSASLESLIPSVLAQLDVKMSISQLISHISFGCIELQYESKGNPQGGAVNCRGGSCCNNTAFYKLHQPFSSLQ